MKGSSAPSSVFQVQSADHPWVKGPISHDPFLIVAGTYRSGTTSLYSYLAGHPEIAASSVKEPAFFFPPRWTAQPPAYPPGHEVESYLSLFKAKPTSRLRLEATPNYLHDPGCAARLRFALPEARIVLTLRDPVERLVSWFKHLRLTGFLPESLDIESWIRAQLASPEAVGSLPYPYQAVAHGRYTADVASFMEAFGRDRVLVLWFDALQSDPLQVMRRVCAFAGLSADFYDGQTLRPQNESMQFRDRRWFTRYLSLRRWIGRPVRALPRLRFRIKEILNKVEPYYVRLLTQPADPVVLPAELRRQLRAYYRQDTAELGRLLGEEVPWAGKDAG
jgi:hypothetical protein